MTTIPVEEFEDDTFGNPLTRRSTWMDRLEAWGFGQTTEAGLLMDDEEYEEAVGGGQEQEGFGLGGDGDGDDENDENDEQYEVDGVIDNRNGDSLLSKQGVGHYGDDGGGGAFQQQAKMHSQGSIRTSESFQGTSVVFGTGGGVSRSGSGRSLPALHASKGQRKEHPEARSRSLRRAFCALARARAVEG